MVRSTVGFHLAIAGFRCRLTHSRWRAVPRYQSGSCPLAFRLFSCLVRLADLLSLSSGSSGRALGLPSASVSRGIVRQVGGSCLRPTSLLRTFRSVIAAWFCFAMS